MLHGFFGKPRFAVAFVAVAMASCSGVALASSDADRVLEKIAILEARISTLETENREYKRDAAAAAHAAVRKATDKTFRTSNAAIPYKAPPKQAYEIPPGQAALSWTGAFWGASAGGAATRSNLVSAQRDMQVSPTNPPPFSINGYDVLGRSGGSKAGGVLDVFAGWNPQFSNFVIGGQIEATTASLNFSSTGSKGYTYFDSNGPTGQTATGDFRPQVTSRWMASALLRAGILLNEQTLVYGIGGWTGAQFEARDITDNPFYQPVETFWANGWTAGAGIERKLDSNWSVRAEYR